MRSRSHRETLHVRYSFLALICSRMYDIEPLSEYTGNYSFFLKTDHVFHKIIITKKRPIKWAVFFKIHMS